MGLDTYVKHAELINFADAKVNLKKSQVDNFRGQVNYLKETLEKYINEHPDFSLIKILNAGSVAKGTALRIINDIDVAVYVKKSSANAHESELNKWLAGRLREAYGKLKKSEDFIPQTHCVKVSFHGSGLDVDVVPVLYDGAANDQGFLITKDSGERVLTSIPQHLAFIRKRKKLYGTEYAQLVRFIKYWKRYQLQLSSDFRFKSFMIELIIAYLFDQNKITTGNYVQALTDFFSYIVRSSLKDKIIFTDYYSVSDVKQLNHSIQIFDPVNPNNNIASQYSENECTAIVNAAKDTLDVLTYARRVTTKQEAIGCWKEIFGSSFEV